MKTMAVPIVTAVLITLLAFSVSNRSMAQENAVEPSTQIVLAADIKWEQLNPKRGDASPKAATLWGNRKGTEATGFLVQFVNGFSSPPHIHNVTYRGVVIGGHVHNDDPDAKAMWMPAGSFWTQPAGEVHITSARGVRTVAYIEIEQGPYLVLPPEEAFDRGERPVNVVPANFVWQDASNTTWIEGAEKTRNAEKLQVAFLWGKLQDDQLNGSLIKLPPGLSAEIVSLGTTLRAVVIEGQPELKLPNETEVRPLTPGSYFVSHGETTHRISCGAEEGCLLYIRSKGKFKVTSISLSEQ